MKKIIILILCVSCSSAFAEIILDIYGASESHARHILQANGEEVRQIEKTFLALLSQGNLQSIDEKSLIKLIERKQQLLQRIQHDNKLLFVDIQTVTYPDDDKQYTTVEVVESFAKNRLRFLDKTKENMREDAQKDPPKDVIDKMQNYEEFSMNLALTGLLKPGPISCPVYHCTFGFDHPQLQAYLPLFDQAARTQKTFIEQTLWQDKDPERRAAAALLIGHYQDPHQIMRHMVKASHSPYQSVRNNAMRVMAATMNKTHDYTINVNAFIDLLDSPYATDRNKALMVLFEAIHSKKSADLIRNNAIKLVNLLKLKQPNNHEYAYLILKEISHKDFGDNDIKSWEKWAEKAI